MIELRGVEILMMIMCYSPGQVRQQVAGPKGGPHIR